MSWLTNWTYRKSHNIAAATGAGTDYQKRITAHYAAPHYQHSEIEDVSEYLRGAGEQFQRYSFYGCGLYWIFYCDNTNIVYKTSSDGVNWFTKIVIRAATQLYMFTILWDDPYIYYVEGGIGTKVYFRRGVPNGDGIITWTSAEVEVANYRATSPCLAKDSDGKIWLTQFKSTDLNVGTFEVIKNDAIDGSWSTASGYPLELSAGIGGRTQGSICTLTDGKMYAAYGMIDVNQENPSLVYGKLFDGGAWGSEETISIENLTSGAGVYVTVDAKDDDVYIVYNVEKEVNKITITFNKRVYGVGWGSEEYISGDLSGGTNLGPVMTFNPDTDELWVIYGDPSVDLIYLRKRTPSGWQDQETIYDFSGVQSASYFILNAFRRPLDGHFAIQFDSNAGISNKVWWLHYAHDINEHVYLGENCQVDFEDVRFTDDDGETLLNYWMQEKVNSDYAIFWLKIADDLSTETQSIYVYYDNESATYPIGDDQDEMDATFLFADHFYGDALDTEKWDEINSPGINVADSICTVTSGDINWRGILGDNVFGAYDIAWMSRNKFSSGARTMAGMSNTGDSVSDDEMCWLSPTLPRSRVCDENSYQDIFFVIGAGTYHEYEITWKSGQCKFFIDGVIKSTHTVDTPNEALKAWITSYNTSQYSDWVAVRKFVDSEPEHGIWSIEDIDSLRGSIVATSDIFGSLTIEDYIELIGSTIATSGATGSLSSEDTLIGSIIETSSVIGIFDLQPKLDGSIVVTSDVTGVSSNVIFLSNGPDWLGIDSSHLDSYCGHDDNQDIKNALDGSGTWYHWEDGEDADAHWVILDLGASYFISEVRSRSLTDMDPTNVDIYISDDKENWGEAVAIGITDWQDTDVWQEKVFDAKRGRYILIDIQDVEGSPASGQLQYGGSPAFTILDVFAAIADQAVSDVSGSLSSIDGLSGSIVETSNITGSLSSLDKLIGSITETSDVTGSLISEYVLIGSITATSDVTGSLNLVGEVLELFGSIVETSGIIGSLDRQPRLYNSPATETIWMSYDVTFKDGAVDWEANSLDTLIASSNIIGCLQCGDPLIGSITAVSDIIGSLSIIRRLIGNGICEVSSTGEISVIRKLTSSAASALSISGTITFIPIGFYESLTNQITTYLQDIADLNGLLVRYDNDLGETPAENLWCEASVDFGNSNKSDLGIDSFRNTGNLNVRIKNSIGLGIGELYTTADIIAEAFKRKNLNRILFEVPRVRNNRRINDDYQLSVICPFFTDKLGK